VCRREGASHGGVFRCGTKAVSIPPDNGAGRGAFCKARTTRGGWPAPLARDHLAPRFPFVPFSSRSYTGR